MPYKSAVPFFVRPPLRSFKQGVTDERQMTIKKALIHHKKKSVSVFNGFVHLWIYCLLLYSNLQIEFSAQKMKLSIKDLFIKCYQILSFLIFCATYLRKLLLLQYLLNAVSTKLYHRKVEWKH